MRSALIAAVVAALVSASTALAVSGAFTHVDVVSTDTTTTALGVRGHEAGRGTIKATHEPAAPGARDPNASVLSLQIAGGARPAKASSSTHRWGRPASC
jgi:hypothetical protein